MYTSYQVLAWGQNAMGQCGLAWNAPPDQSSAILVPTVIGSLSGLGIRQVSAGLTHSAACTSAPLEHPFNGPWRSHFTVEVHREAFESLVSMLRSFSSLSDDSLSHISSG